MLWDALPSALDLARFQFAFTVTFHFLFRPSPSGWRATSRCWKGLWLWTGREAYLDVFRYWLKVFAVAFAMGVVSGLVMSYQFGTNWSVFADRTGPVLGPVMAYEVLTAFFLEAGFLGIMLFGLGRVGKWPHFAATCLVAVGTLISGFWILSPTPGCTRRRATPSRRTAASCRRTGGRSSSTRPSRSATCTP
jgi:cytochrome d ubiquinol oxidase subunit I